MGDVLRVSFAFPTVIFTVLIGVALVLWMVSLAGFGDAEDAADGVLEDFLSPIGLAGVPTNVLVSLFALFAWATSAILSLTVLDAVSGAAAILVGIGVAIAAIFVGYGVLRALAPRLSRTFTPAFAHRADDLVGRTAEVRSTSVTATAGYGDVRAPDGTTDRVDLRLRPDAAEPLDISPGDDVLIVAYDQQRHVYLVDTTPL